MLKKFAQELDGGQGSRLVSKSPVFYGWVILLAGTLGTILTSPGQTYALSIFTEHFIRDLGISRSLASILFMVGTLGGSLSLPWIGRQIDRYGTRPMVAIIALLFGLACIYMGLVQNAVMLGLGFISVRMLGQGALGLVSQNVINQWWVRRRGTVMGLSGVLVSLLGLGGFPTLIHWLISLYDWRFTYMLLGLILIGVMMPLGFLLFRAQPELYGLRPDGGWPGRKTVKSPAGDVDEENWTLEEASRTLAFWVLGLGLAVLAMSFTGLFFHMAGIFTDNGLSADVAASIFLPIALTSALANLGSGLLVDRIPPRFLLTATLTCMAVALWLAPALTRVEQAFLYGLLVGTAMGLMRTSETVLWAAYFGRRHLGSITGVAFTILVCGSSLGPIPVGFARDLLGNYTLVLKGLALLPLVLGLTSLAVGRPRKRT